MGQKLDPNRKVGTSGLRSFVVTVVGSRADDTAFIKSPDTAAISK
jgi:hypothetical protein